MKNIFKKVAILLALIVWVSTAFADQAAWISEDQANKARAIIEKQEKIVSFCSPCKDEKAKVKTVKKVSVEKVGDGYWEVVVNDEGIDLAYVYVLEAGEWTNLAMLLSIDVDSVPFIIKPKATGTRSYAKIEINNSWAK